MLTVLTQGPPFLSRNWASERDAYQAPALFLSTAALIRQASMNFLVGIVV